MLDVSGDLYIGPIIPASTPVGGGGGASDSVTGGGGGGGACNGMQRLSSSVESFAWHASCDSLAAVLAPLTSSGGRGAGSLRISVWQVKNNDEAAVALPAELCVRYSWCCRLSAYITDTLYTLYPHFFLPGPPRPRPRSVRPLACPPISLAAAHPLPGLISCVRHHW